MMKRVGMATATMMSDSMILSGMGQSVPRIGSGNWWHSYPSKGLGTTSANCLGRSAIVVERRRIRSRE